MSPEARAAPRATVVADKGAVRLLSLNAAAVSLGLAPGLALADARARFPGLAVSEATPDADAHVLMRFADACERYTPLLALDGRAGLLLDVTGCAHLFGGEEGLVRDLLRRVGAQGFAARAALAATSGAAFALARFSARGERRAGAGVVVPQEEDLVPLLSPLSLAALRLEEGALGALARLGFRRVGDLVGKPRAPLAARFGAGLLDRLDAALGTAPAAVDYRFSPPVFCAERNLFEPVERVEDVLGLTLKLAASLVPALERQGVGTRRLELSLFRVDGKVTRLVVGTGRPLRDPQAIRRLFAEKLAAVSCLDAGFGFDLLRLAVREAAPMAERQSGFAADTDGAEALDGLIDRLSIRFGTRQVQVLVAEDRHWPDASSRAVPAQAIGAAALLAGAAGGLAGDEGWEGPVALPAEDRRGGVATIPDLCGPDRPLRLFDRPEPVEAVAEVPDGPPLHFRWRRRRHEVSRAEGPERIAAEWWRKGPQETAVPTRDYFRVETREGHRFWLFRAGLYGRETSEPRWFIHGLFG